MVSLIQALFHLGMFIVIGLFLTTIPEWQNNVLMNAETSGWAGYQGTMMFNALLLIFSYILFKLLQSRVNQEKTTAVLFTFWGIVGLLIEWVLINHPPWSDAIQYSMFVYWGCVFSIPALFVLEKTKQLRKRLLLYIVSTSVVMVIGSFITLAADPSKVALLLFIIASWSLVFSYLISFLLEAVGRDIRKRWLIAAAVVIPFAEIVIPYPFDFAAFLLVLGYSYWYVLRKK